MLFNLDFIYFILFIYFIIIIFANVLIIFFTIRGPRLRNSANRMFHLQNPTTNQLQTRISKAIFVVWNRITFKKMEQESDIKIISMQIFYGSAKANFTKLCTESVTN